jgi:DNA-binding beta-propeller fold protein YncE
VRRVFPAGLSALFIVGLAALPVGAQDQADRLDLPGGWSPEGVTAIDGTLYAGSLGNGAIWTIDTAAEDIAGQRFAPGKKGRVTVGIEASPDGQTLWAAGGRTGEIRAYDVATGQFTTWTVDDAGFYNDIAATDEAVYVTDSFVPELRVLDLTQAEGKARAFEALPFSGDLEYGDGFNVNGIVAAPAGLVVVHSSLGMLFRVDPETGETFAIDSGDVALTGGDGLELDGDILYVIRNSSNTVTALQLDESLQTATLIAELSHDEFDTPTTAALIGEDLWVVNARFGTPAEKGTDYWVTRLDAVGSEEG